MSEMYAEVFARLTPEELETGRILTEVAQNRDLDECDCDRCRRDVG